MRTVACVLKSGSPDPVSPWRGAYTPECVYALRNMVKANLKLPHDFVCLTDYDLPDVDTVKLDHDWRGWWSKMELFRLVDGPVLYFDLDTFINKPIDIMFDVPGPFVMIQDFTYPDIANSGVMRWDGDFSELYNDFIKFAGDDKSPNVRYKRRNGDQAFIGARITPQFWQDHLPAGFLKSFKKGGQGEDLRETPVVCFHGTPKPHDSDGWIRKYWESWL